MSLLQNAHISTRSPDNSGIFLLTAQELKAGKSSNCFVVNHKEGLGELTFGFDYLDDNYVGRDEFEDIHLNVGADYSEEKANGWHKHVGAYVVDVVRLWKLIQASEPFYANFQINRVILGQLCTDLSQDEVFVHWVESLVVRGRDMDDVENALTACMDYSRSQIR